jgi:hypothetical protein
VLGLLPYACPNDPICGSRFSNVQQLSAHSSENIVDANGLAEIYAKLETDSTTWKIDTHCIQCSASTRGRYLDPEYVFKAGAKIQSSLNNKRKFRGLSACVAFHVVLSSILYMKTCHICSYYESPEDWQPMKPETRKRYILERPWSTKETTLGLLVAQCYS